MKKQNVNIAKITQPDVSKILQRHKLSQQMEESRKVPITWISGPPGSGKTSLVSSVMASRKVPCIWYKIDASDINPASFYFNFTRACQKVSQQTDNLPVLASEKNLEIPDFNRNFFTELLSCFNNSFNLVLDNYQNIPDDIPLHDLILDTLNFMPESANLIIISRNGPPSKFSRLVINRRMNHISWQDLRFTQDEFQDVIAQWGFGKLPEELIRGIYNKLDGWIAGLVFMLESTKKYNTSLQNIGTEAFDTISNYFAEEVFNYLDSDVRHFLLKTSLLPTITPKLAHTITGLKQSCKILTFLQHHNIFVDKLNGSQRGAYIYHPMFKEYLAGRLEDFFDGDEIIDLQRKAAAMLFEINQVEDAVNLLKAAEDWQGLIQVIAHKAEDLLAQGRSQLLQEWLATIPQDKLRENPWLSYWWGQSLQYVKPQMAREYYGHAFSAFCEQQSMVGAFTSWTGLVDTTISQAHNFRELDSLIDWMEQHFYSQHHTLASDVKGKLSSAMISAMMIRRPGSKSLEKWVEYTNAEAMSATNVELSMQACLAVANYYLWRGDQSNCWVLLSRIRNLCRSSDISSFSVLQSKCLEATMYAWLLSDGKKCLETIEQALEIGQCTGIRSMDHRLYVTGAFGALIDRNYKQMNDYLQRIEKLLGNSNQHNFFCHDYLSAWLSLAKGNVLRGLQHARQAIKTAKATGYVYHEALGLFVKVQIMFEKGEFKKANAALELFKKIIEPTNSMLLQNMYFLTKAQFSIDLGKQEVGLKYLHKAMKLGREENYQNLMCWWNPTAMTKLCIYALDNNIETEYVRDLINKQCLVPASSPIEIERWPWTLKIYTFGRFEIVKNGKPLRSNGKAQQKPLAMLKALISLGGRSVPEFHLAEALWPDADGDMQHQSLATTLHRLRRILGHKDMVEFNDGHLSLNPRQCWVDAWAFERLLSQGEVESRKKEKKSSCFAAMYAERAIELYKGNFMPQNSVDHWSIHMREKLKSRFLRGVSFLGRNLEKIEEQDKAITFYQKALEIDPLVEEFYQRLMICYHRMGRHADAVLIYRRCLKSFDKVLRVPPSTQTKALYNNLLVKQYGHQGKISLLKKNVNM